jgi:hypothetical protein
MKTQLLSSIECSERLGVPLHKIAYAQRRGRIKKPTYLVAGKAIYTQADLRRMAKFFNVELALPEVGLDETKDEGSA